MKINIQKQQINDTEMAKRKVVIIVATIVGISIMSVPILLKWYSVKWLFTFLGLAIFINGIVYYLVGGGPFIMMRKIVNDALGRDTYGKGNVYSQETDRDKRETQEYQEQKL